MHAQEHWQHSDKGVKGRRKSPEVEKDDRDRHRNPARKAARAPEMDWGGGVRERGPVLGREAEGGQEGGVESFARERLQRERSELPSTPSAAWAGGGTRLRVTGTCESRLPGPH